MQFFRRRKAAPTIDPEKLLYLPANPLQALAPVDPPSNADDRTKLFFSESEWLQPFLNRHCSPLGIIYNESDNTNVLLPWDPVFGRNFKIFCNAAPIGEVSVWPCYASEEGWAQVKIRLVYPVGHLEGEEVHSILTSLIRATGRQVESEPEPLATMASALASKAMTIAMWDKRPDTHPLIECMTQGPWDAYWSTVEHWNAQSIDPWEKWERHRGSN